MTLLDSNVLIYTSDPGVARNAWARRIITCRVSTDRDLATADTVRIRSYFPAVRPVAP